MTGTAAASSEPAVGTEAPGAARRDLHLGARVRVADAKTLTAALRRADRPRPEPTQMAAAGRHATIVGYRRGPAGGERYVLSNAPGLWHEDWLVPA